MSVFSSPIRPYPELRHGAGGDDVVRLAVRRAHLPGILRPRPQRLRVPRPALRRRTGPLFTFHYLLFSLPLSLQLDFKPFVPEPHGRYSGFQATVQIFSYFSAYIILILAEKGENKLGNTERGSRGSMRR